MKLKKANAFVGLLSILFLLLHAGYSVYCYLTFYYNPFLKNLTAYPFIVCVCLHAIFAMILVFTRPDGTRMDLYPKQNLGTLLQRISAALLFPFLILHINTYSLLSWTASHDRMILFWLLVLSQFIFFGLVLTHICISFSRALISLGWLTSRETQKKIDRVVYVLGALVFLVAVISIVRGEIKMIPMFQGGYT